MPTLKRRLGRTPGGGMKKKKARHNASKYGPTPSKKMMVDSNAYKTPGAEAKTPGGDMKTRGELILQDIPELPPELERLYRIVGYGTAYQAGTFASVYKAERRDSIRDKKYESHVAIKHLHSFSSVKPLVEINVMRKLGGKGFIPKLIRTFAYDNKLCMVMPYIHHVDFEEYFWRMTEREIRDYMGALLSSLKHLADAGYIHRDVKPANMLHRPANWNHDGGPPRYVLVDFGLAQQRSECDTKSSMQHEQLETIRLNNVKVDDFHPCWISKRAARFKPNRTRSNAFRSPRAGRPASCFSRTSAMKRTPAAGYRSVHHQSRMATDANATLPYTPAMKTPFGGTSTAIKTELPPIPSQDVKYNGFLHTKDNVELPVANEIIDKPLRRADRSGTRGFRAPEVLLKTHRQNPKVDVWAAGIIMLSMMTKVFPFFNSPNDEIALMEIIHIVGLEKLNAAASRMGRRVSIQDWGEDNPWALDLEKGRGGFVYFAKDLLKRHVTCQSLPHNPCPPPANQRLDSEDSAPPLNSSMSNSGGKITTGNWCYHARTFWSEQCWDVLRQLLDSDQYSRPTAEQILKHPFFNRCASIRL